MGKNVSVEDQLLDAIATGRSIKLELSLSACLKIFKLQSRVDELTKAKGELLQKLAKSENRYELLEAHNQEKEQAKAAYNEDVKTLLEKGVFEVVPAKPVRPCNEIPLAASEPKSSRSTRSIESCCSMVAINRYGSTQILPQLARNSNGYVRTLPPDTNSGLLSFKFRSRGMSTAKRNTLRRWSGRQKPTRAMSAA